MLIRIEEEWIRPLGVKMRGIVVILHAMMAALCYLYTCSVFTKPDKAEMEASIASMRAITDLRPMTGHAARWFCGAAAPQSEASPRYSLPV